MENRDAIIRKLNAIKAKANNAGTPEEALVFANAFEKMMEKYRLTESDLEIKNSTIDSVTKKPTKATDKMELICNAIAVVTDTHAVRDTKTGNFVFFGIGADIQYADWLYNLIANSLERAYHELALSPVYHELLNNKVKPDHIKNNFKIGFLAAVHVGLQAIIDERKAASQALVVLKHGLILAHIDQQGKRTEKSVDVKLYDGAHVIAAEGFKEGEKVKLRKGVAKETPKLLK